MELPHPPETVSLSLQFNTWLFELIEPWLKGRVLELGSTLDSISSVFVQKGRRIHLSTSHLSMHGRLQSLYNGLDTVRMVHSIDIHRNAIEEEFQAGLAGAFDTVLGFNAVNDGAYDKNIVENAGHFLNTKGRLILIMPIFTTAYDGFTLDLEHLKIYNMRAIRTFLTCQMEILRGKYFELPVDAGYDRSGLSVMVVARKI